MTFEKTSGSPPSGGMATLRRLGQYSLFFATAGFACPNVFSEDLETAKLDDANKIKIPKP